MAAIGIFVAQTYDKKELLILDDGEDAFDMVSLPNVRYYRETPGRSLGEKYNYLADRANGHAIIQCADDDWYAPWRIEYQLSELKRQGVDMVCTDRVYWIDPRAQKGWLHECRITASLMYKRRVWCASPYRDVQSSEDAYFVSDALAHGFTLGTAPDWRFLVQRLHEHNSTSKGFGEQWTVPFEEVRAVIGSDYDTYFGGGDNGLPR